MKKYKNIFLAALMAACLSCLFCQPAFAAVSESEVQAQVDAAGREAVSGNVLIWFLCAVAFLKVSQKIDSFMASLGVNVGHTGGSMLAEAMIATRGLGGIRNFSRQHFGNGGPGSLGSAKTGGGRGSGFGGGFMGGGLAGVISRNITNSAAKTATSASAPGSSGGTGGLGAMIQKASGGVGGNIYSSSVSKGGDFANHIISTVATGNVATHGMITGEKAAEAMSSYMGYAALGENAGHIPAFSNVEIGGGRITGTETSEEHPEGISFGMYHAAQYAAPDGAHTTVHAADGTTWYKQYAMDSVDKSPYLAPDGSIAYNESIVKKLPPAPHRKDKM